MRHEFGGFERRRGIGSPSPTLTREGAKQDGLHDRREGNFALPGFSASRDPADVFSLPGGCAGARSAPAPRARSLACGAADVAVRPLAARWPVLCGSRGGTPGPPQGHPCATRAPPRHGLSPEARPEPGRRGCRSRPPRPVLARRGRTTRRPAGRRTGSPPPESGARHPSGTPPPGTARRVFFAPPRRRRSPGVRGGTAPRPASAGDARSVATGSMLAPDR